MSRFANYDRWKTTNPADEWLGPDPEDERCSWCNVLPSEAAARHEGPHLTWCPHFRDWQRGPDEYCIACGAEVSIGDLCDECRKKLPKRPALSQPEQEE